MEENEDKAEGTAENNKTGPFTINHNGSNDVLALSAGDYEAKIQELQHANFSLGNENTILNDKLKAIDLVNNSLVNKAQLTQLIDQVNEYKDDIIPLVSVFGIITQFIGEDSSMLKITMMLPSLLKNKQIVNQIEAIIPIVKKYTQAPENNGE